MGMRKEEMMKIFDFLIENKKLILSDNGLFSFNTLKMIRDIVKGKTPNNFQLTEEQKQLMVESFVNSNQVFSEETPDFLLTNDSCIKASIDRDINSINFLLFLPPNLETYIIEKTKEEHFVLKENSLDCIRSCYEIVFHSIQHDVKSADFILWECISEEKRKTLIDKMIENGYVLSENSDSFLQRNQEVVMASIQKDLDSFQYADGIMKDNYPIVRYLLFHDYDFKTVTISNFPLTFFVDPEFMNGCLKKMGVYDSTDGEYRRRLTEVYSDALKKLPSISTFQSVFEFATESSWKVFRKDNSEDFDNIFGIICAELKENAADLDDALENLNFLENMEETLGNKKYNILLQAMEEYFNIFHSETADKIAKIQPSKNMIAELSALYVSKAKENYKKEELEDHYEWLRRYFTIRMDHPMIEKRMIQTKQKREFRRLYFHNDENTDKFLENIIQKYNNILDENLFKTMIGTFIELGDSKLNQIIDEPDYYSDYVKYQKAIKLIHRLNSGFIQYDGVEMNNYRNIISYDDAKKEYVYSGLLFEKDEITEFEDYKKKMDIFEKIKREITSRIRKIEVDNQVDDDLLEALEEELPFTDEYFIFDPKILERFNFHDLLVHAHLNKNFIINDFKSDSIYHNIYQLLVNNGMIWLSLFMHDYTNYTLRNYITTNRISLLIDDMNQITSLSKQIHFNLADFKELLLAAEMSEYINATELAILGKEVAEKINKHQSYTEKETGEIISMATELVAQMAKRNKSTIPYVSGQTMNYKYSLYDSQDETLLLAGINTDACFKVDGNDNDFLHYCALDKNGFVIKITDYDENFIARASGFRNGNCIFINQLRTIYDRGGCGYKGQYISEKEEIIETFKKACEEIVSISQKNEQEIDKIDHIFVTQSYSLGQYPSNVSDDVFYEIGSSPMDYNSKDWLDFINNTENLKDGGEDFNTDYGSYSLICMASIKEPEKIIPKDIKPKNVEALYERKRVPIMIRNQVDDSILKRINKIKGIQCYFAEKDFESIEVPTASVILAGDNWYIIYHNGCIIDSCLLEFDEKAKIEFEAASLVLEEEKINNSTSPVDIEKIMNSISVDFQKNNVKVKKIGTIFDKFLKNLIRS